MEKIDFNKYEPGKLNESDVKTGFVFEGKFYEIGSPELENLFNVEGIKPEHEGTLLGLTSKYLKNND